METRVIPGTYSTEEFKRLKEQDEISFKAGQQSMVEEKRKAVMDAEEYGRIMGIREVVGFVKKHFTQQNRSFLWQEKLKEWPIGPKRGE